MKRRPAGKCLVNFADDIQRKDCALISEDHRRPAYLIGTIVIAIWLWTPNLPEARHPIRFRGL